MEKEGRVLSLITQDPTNEQKFVVCAETIQRMHEFEGEFCFISICGDYRSGKSFLLNALFPQCCGFETSAATNSCTKGINIWSRPIRQGSLNIWIVDTEGFGSIEKDADHDGKLFLLNILLSNLLIYNSVGAIDQLALAKLALVCRHAAALDHSAAKSKFFWVLRDFALQMADRSGRQLTANQYLEECLREGHGGQRAEKEFLRGLFQERHCVTLIRPLIDQERLGSLRQVKWDSLREEFRNAVQELQENLLKSAEGKVVNGIHINNHNFDILVSQFVTAINSGKIDCGLNCTYQRILEHEQNTRKEAIQAALSSKAEAVRRIMPVQLQHIAYLRQQLAQTIKTQLRDLEGHSTPVALQLINLQLTQEASLILESVEKENRQKAAEEAKEYLYRQLVEMCPRLVSLSQQGFEVRFQQAFGRLKDDYCAKYATFLSSQSLEGVYSQFAQREERKVFFQVTKRWRTSLRQLEEKTEELRKSKRVLEDENKKAKEERERALQNLENVRREEARNLQRMKDEVEDAFREEAKNIASGYEARMQEQMIRWEDEMATLREAVDRAESERSQIRTEAQYQKQSLLERVTAERQRTELLNAKWEQARNSLELQLDQTRNSLQNKLRIAQLKHSDLQNTLSNQRRKYQLISEQRKSQEMHLLQELAQRNHRIDELTDQLTRLESKYRGQLQRILLEEKDIICKTLTAKINEYEYRCKTYEARLAQSANLEIERAFHQHRSEQLELQMRELKASLQEQSDRIVLLANKLKKCEAELDERDNAIAAAREQHIKQVNLLNQNLLNSKNFLREAEQRHAQELQWLRGKMEGSMREQASNLADKHAQTLENLKAQWEAKWQQEKSQLKEAIRNGYDETEGLRMALLTITAHTDKVAAILTRVLHQHHRPNSQQSHADSSHLTDIAQSPEEDTERQSPGKRQLLMRQTEFLAEQIEEAFNGLREQVEYLGKERAGIREELRASIDELQSYEQAISKFKQQNRSIRNELQEYKRKATQAEAFGKELAQLREKLEVLQRENGQLRRECELKQQLLASRDEHHRQSSLIYKETIAGLNDQNKQLASRAADLAISNEAFQAELERFQIWATEVKAKSSTSLPPEELQMSAEKIRDLQSEIKRLARQLQQSKAEKVEKREVNLYTPLLQENRVNELEALRADNYRLLQQLQQKQQLEVKTQQEKRISRQRHSEQEQARYVALREDYETLKRRSKDTINALEAKIGVYEEENRQIRQEFQQLEENIMQKYEFSRKMMEQETEQLKRQKQSLADFYTKKMQTLQDTLNNKTHEADKRIAEADLRFEQFRDELQKEHNRIMLEGERHRLKYEHLLKVNGQLIKEVQMLKSKAHQITIKQKYKSRISSLFDD